VAASAGAETVTTPTIGALSERRGRRRAFIAGGYAMWGLSTAAFGLISVDAVTEAAAVLMLIVPPVLARRRRAARTTEAV
jgi:hypothetical protein